MYRQPSEIIRLALRPEHGYLTVLEHRQPKPYFLRCVG